MIRVKNFIELQLLNFILWSNGSGHDIVINWFLDPKSEINLAYNREFFGKYINLNIHDEKNLEELFR